MYYYQRAKWILHHTGPGLKPGRVLSFTLCIFKYLYWLPSTSSVSRVSPAHLCGRSLESSDPPAALHLLDDGMSDDV